MSQFVQLSIFVWIGPSPKCGAISPNDTTATVSSRPLGPTDSSSY